MREKAMCYAQEPPDLAEARAAERSEYTLSVLRDIGSSYWDSLRSHMDAESAARMPAFFSREAR